MSIHGNIERQILSAYRLTLFSELHTIAFPEDAFDKVIRGRSNVIQHYPRKIEEERYNSM